MHGFYWLIDDVLAGCPRPGGQRADETALDRDLRWLAQQGIRAVVSLTEQPLQGGALARHGLAELHLAVDDLTSPSPPQLEAGLAFIDYHRARGYAVAVHCRMGQGRTGTLLAAYLIRAGWTGADALAELRAVCPGAIGSPSQEQALADYARRRDWVV
jgi:atypical dual specificity phosphatase